MLEIAERVEHVVLFSGDGGYRRLVEAVQRRGARVTVISTTAGNASSVADELRRQADMFVDLRDLRSEVTRERASRSARDEDYDDDYDYDGPEDEFDDDYEDDDYEDDDRATGTGD